MKRMRLAAALVIRVALVAVFAVSTGGAASAQSRARRPVPAPADAASVESAIAAYYAAMSHAAGAAPDFERLRGIFLYVGMIIPPKSSGENFSVRDVDALEDAYRKQPGTSKDKGLVEREVARKVDCFGNVCHVMSTYEARWTESDARPFERGVRSMQLLRDGNRWWIASVTWDVERPDNAIPSQFLPQAAPAPAAVSTPSHGAGGSGR